MSRGGRVLEPPLGACHNPPTVRNETGAGDEAAAALVLSLERPHPNLFVYYLLLSLLLGPLFFLALLPATFRYHTLRYRFDDQGVSMRWGVLFRREISLTYSRIQDIHLASNAIERWLGLARVQVQTASGASGAEMTIEGLQEYAAVRDFLYGRMRGAKEHDATPRSKAPSAPPGELVAVAEALREVGRELSLLRADLARRGGRGGEPAASDVEARP